jgi:hypothetical protein
MTPSHSVLPLIRQSDADSGAFLDKEFVRNLYRHACTVAGLRIAAACASMCEIDENLDAFCYDIVRFLAANVYDKSDTAGIMFIPGIVQRKLFFLFCVH